MIGTLFNNLYTENYNRSLINMYAQLAPPRWEDPNTREITIRRVRTPRPPIRIHRNPQ